MSASSPLHDPVLRGEWLAVCASQDVRDAPERVHVLGVQVVLWRGPAGLTAFRDLCVHRGTALSLGRVEDGTLVCPYHGWRYDQSGQCVLIPAQPELSIPTKAKAERYHALERYGLVWLCLGEPRGEPPTFPEAEAPGFHTLICGPYDVQAEAPRVVENFLDVSHLMWVHEGYLGNPNHAEIPDYRVHDRGDRLESDTIRIFQPDPDGRGQGVTNHYVYGILGPLTARFSKTDQAAQDETAQDETVQDETVQDEAPRDVFAMLLHATPTGVRQTRAYAVLARNYALDTPDQVFRDFQDAIFAQDETILVSQRPEQLPLDLAAELHIRSDRLAIAYRRWLGELGVTVGVA